MSTPRRADAVRSRTAILDSCLRLLDEGKDPSVGAVAAAAGVTRQTVYAHFASRDELLHAATELLTAEVTASLSGTDPRQGSLGEAVDRWCETVWGAVGRRPGLLNPALATGAGAEPAGDALAAHEVVVHELRILAQRARRERGLPRAISTDWLVRAVIAHGHAAGGEVAAGRMTARAAGVAFRYGVRGLLLGDPDLVE